jgi:hypothetical protein
VASQAAYNGADMSGIALGNIAITTRTITGIVTGLPSAGEWDVEIAALSQRVTQENSYMAESYLVSWGEAEENGSWSLLVTDDAPKSLWFMVMMYDEASESEHAYITTAASDAETVILNIKTMTELAGFSY